MDVIEIRPDFESDPDGSSLAAFLAAQRAAERANYLRVLLAHVTAVLGLPVWFTAIGYVWGLDRELALAAFGVSAGALALAVVYEVRSKRAARAAEMGLRVSRMPS